MIKHSVLPVSQVMQSRLWAADSEAASCVAVGQQTVRQQTVGSRLWAADSGQQVVGSRLCKTPWSMYTVKAGCRVHTRTPVWKVLLLQECTHYPADPADSAPQMLPPVAY